MSQTQIIFEFTTKYGVFRDALHLPEDHDLTDEQIAAMKQERLDNWIASIEVPPLPLLPPAEELTEEAAPDA